MNTFIFAILVLGVSAPVAAQWLDHPARGIPRTAGFKPLDPSVAELVEQRTESFPTDLHGWACARG